MHPFTDLPTRQAATGKILMLLINTELTNDKTSVIIIITLKQVTIFFYSDQ